MKNTTQKLALTGLILGGIVSADIEAIGIKGLWSQVVSAACKIGAGTTEKSTHNGHKAVAGLLTFGLLDWWRTPNSKGFRAVPFDKSSRSKDNEDVHSIKLFSELGPIDGRDATEVHIVRQDRWSKTGFRKCLKTIGAVHEKHRYHYKGGEAFPTLKKAGLPTDVVTHIKHMLPNVAEDDILIIDDGLCSADHYSNLLTHLQGWRGGADVTSDTRESLTRDSRIILSPGITTKDMLTDLMEQEVGAREIDKEYWKARLAEFNDKLRKDPKSQIIFNYKVKEDPKEKASS